MSNPTQKAGEVILRFVADSTKLRKGYDEAAETLDNFEREANSTKSSVDKLTRQINDTGEEARAAKTKLDKLVDVTEGTGEAARTTTRLQIDLTDAIIDVGREARETEQSVERLNTDIDNTGRKSQSSRFDLGKLKNSFSDMKIAGVGVAGVIAGVTAALIALTTASVDAAEEYGEAMRTIRSSTGSTGDDLAALADSYKTLRTTVTNEDRNIAETLSFLSKAYPELAKEQLEELTQTYLGLEKLGTGLDTGSLESTRAMFNKWGVEAEDQTEKLNEFYRISQATGTSVADLVAILESGDRGFQLLGWAIDDAALAIGTLAQKDGIDAALEFTSALEAGIVRLSTNTETAVETTKAAYEAASAELNALISSGAEDNAIAIAEATREKTDAWNEYQKALANSDAGAIEDALKNTIISMSLLDSETEATQLGIEVFGKSADKVAGALAAGVLDVDALRESLKNYDDTVIDVVEETETLSDKLTIYGNMVSQELVPSGEYLADILDRYDPLIQGMIIGFGKLVKPLQDVNDLCENSPMYAFLDGIQEWCTSGTGSKIIEYIELINTNLDNTFDSIERSTGIFSFAGSTIEYFKTIVGSTLETLGDLAVMVLAVMAGDWSGAAEIGGDMIGRWKEVALANPLIEKADAIEDSAALETLTDPTLTRDIMKVDNTLDGVSKTTELFTENIFQNNEALTIAKKNLDINADSLQALTDTSVTAANQLDKGFDTAIDKTIGKLGSLASSLRTVISLQSQVGATGGGTTGTSKPTLSAVPYSGPAVGVPDTRYNSAGAQALSKAIVSTKRGGFST